MTANHEPSVEELRRESERTRAALTTTVSDLREKVSETAADLKTRISPAHIKEELKDYVREGSDNLVQSIERRVRDNPLQAVAIGAALAYPLWSIVRAIPAPIMLVGAGLWFAGKSGKSSVEQIKAKAGEVAESATARVSDLAASAQTAARPGVRRIADAFNDAGAALSSGVGTVSDKTMAAAQDVRDSVAGMGHTVVESLTQTAGNATAAVSETASAVKDRAVQAAEQSRNVFVDMVDRNPLLVAARCGPQQSPQADGGPLA